MTDAQLHSALSRLAPQVDDAPDWDDVERRAGAGLAFARGSPRSPWLSAS
jgi:hypothetical protein